jgi:WD40 repeat protein
MKRASWNPGSLILLILAVSLSAVRGDPGSSLRHLWKTQTQSNGMNSSVLFTPDGNQLISAGADGVITFLQRSDGAVLTNWPAHTGAVNSLALSADGTLLISGGQDRYVKIWNLAEGILAQSFLAHTATVAAVALSPDKTLVASAGGADHEVKLWRVTDGSLARAMPTLAGFHPTESVAFSPDGQYVGATGPAVWPVTGGPPIFWYLPNATQPFLDGAQVKFSPDGDVIIGSVLYGVWAFALPGHQTDLFVPSPSYRAVTTFSPDGASLVSVSTEFDLELVWADFRARKPIKSYRCWGDCVERYKSLAFDPRMNALAISTESGAVVLAELPVWISTAQASGTNLSIAWQGGTGPFQLQQTPDASDRNWNDVGMPIATNSVTTPIAGGTALFRIRDLAPTNPQPIVPCSNNRLSGWFGPRG